MNDFDHSQCWFQVGQRIQFRQAHGYLHPYFDLSGAGTVVQVIPTPGGYVYNVRLDEPRNNGLFLCDIAQCMGDEIEALGA